MAERTLIIGLILFLFAVFFNIYSLPGTTELTVVSAPIIALLLFRYHRLYFKFERNFLIKTFTLINSGFISLLILIAALGIIGLSSIKYATVLAIGWSMLLATAAIYYLYYWSRASTRRFKMGYFTFLLFVIFHFVEILITIYFRDEFSVTTLFYTILLVLGISVFVFLPLLRHLNIPKKHLAGSVVIGGIFMYALAFIMIVPKM